MLTNYIAHLCPQAGGPAIYKARAMYQLFNDTVTYNDSVVCRQVGFFRESEAQLMPTLKEEFKPLNIRVYPNPARDKINLIIDGNVSAGFIYIYNALGLLVNVIQINEDTHQKEIDLSNYAEGMYILNYQGGNMSFKKSFIKLK